MKVYQQDIQQFARWSGDVNPLHVDPEFAARTFFGRTIAHGMLSVIRALGDLRVPPAASDSWDIEFRGAMVPDAEYEVESDCRDDAWSLVVRAGSHPLLVIRGSTAAGGAVSGNADVDLGWTRDLVGAGSQERGGLRTAPADRQPVDLAPGLELKGVYTTGDLPPGYVAGALLTPTRTRVLALCSYVVGMEAPGLRSLFTRATLRFVAETGDSGELLYQLKSTRFDSHFRILDTDLVVADRSGHLVATARLRSYVRFSPVTVPAREMRARLTPVAANLAGKVALVCGGTRGLGADLTAALALAGANVHASYRTDQAAARALADELGREGASVTLVQGDVGDPAWCQATLSTLEDKHGRVDLVVLNACAPPQPARIGGGPGDFDRYVLDNLRLAGSPLATFLPALEASGGAVVTISSSFVDDPPPNFGHYVALKQAVEGMARTAAREAPGAYFTTPRPPRLQTSWNDTPTGVIDTIPSDWAASHIVNELAARWQAGRYDVVTEFPPFADHAPVQHEEREAEFTLAVAASFTVEPIVPGLRFWFGEIGTRAQIEVAPYGQVLQSLLDPSSALHRHKRGANVVMLRVADWLRELPAEQSSSLEFLETYLKETTTDFERAVRAHRQQASAETLLVICPSGTPQAGGAVERLIAETAARLPRALEATPGLQVLVASELHATYGVDDRDVGDAMREHLAHIPYSDAYYHVLATMTVRRLHQKLALPRKAVVVDCDNTLWRGVVGEVGAEGVTFDRSHQALSATLAGLSQNGVLVCLCSKNEESDVWSVFDTRADLGLKREHVVAAMINWQPKSQNLRTLAARLNLGLDSFVFIDDNPVECAEVRAGCPEVLTLQWPRDAEKAVQLLEHAWELDITRATTEDKKRTQMYREEFGRQALRSDTLSFRDFIDSLGLVVEVSPLSSADLKRASQLTLRTNQFNFTTRRREEGEFQALVAAGTHEIRTVRVRDRFGDYGLVGLVIAEPRADHLALDTFLMSCRVLGRGAEHRMAAELGRIALERGLGSVRLTVETTKRNLPARAFLESIAPDEYRKEDTPARLDCEVPASTLADVRFEPAEQTAEAAVDVDQPSPGPGAGVDARSVRRREELIGRTAWELSTPAGLRRSIEGHSEGAPVASARGEDDVAAVVYGAFASALGMTPEVVQEVDRLEALGCDSFKIVEITVALSDEFPWLPGTLLFEHRTVSEIARHIVDLARAGEERGAGHEKGAPVAERGRSGEIPIEEIAVVGMHVRCAGAKSPAELWELLRAGRSAVVPVPAAREGFLGTLRDSRPHWAGLLDDVSRFDAEFFGVSPREAELMDPQLRLLLEVAWGALEDAGCAGADHDVDTGVFVGVMYGDYAYRANLAARGSESPYKSWEGFSLANRLSQALGFRGPSIAIDTACSSSGTALHLACRALSAGDCRAAVVGGVNLILDPDRFAQLGRLGILSATGRCLAFGAEADGTVLGEGVGVVVLRPLTEAIRRGDRIYGVIKGTGLSTGSGTVGFTAPNPQAQSEAIERAIRASRLDPRTVSYVETHGTGTALGDPIEVRGLTLAYGNAALFDAAVDGEQRCTIGSIKPNIGHLEAGAGALGLVKVLLQLSHGMLVPSITSAEPNPQIPFADTPFAIQRTLAPWEPPVVDIAGVPTSVPRRAGLSSFGVGGANAHVIVEEPPQAAAPEDERPERSCHLLGISARSDGALRQLAASLGDHLETASDLSLPDACFSTNTGRRHFDRRVALAAVSREQLVELLGKVGRGEEPRGSVKGSVPRLGGRPKIAFLFTGQGSQYAGMGRDLYRSQPVFREALDQCATIFDRLIDKPLLSLLFAAEASPEADLLNQTGYTQPALFAFEYALAELWRSWGVVPDAVMGHSVGEFAALTVAGAISLDDGLKLIAARGRLMQALPSGGAMVSVMADEARVATAIAGYEDRVSIGAVNGPQQVVISGDGATVAEIAERFGAEGVKTKALTVSHAFHSPLMDPMLDEFASVVSEVRIGVPRIPFVSCVTGEVATSDIASAEYWRRQVRNGVRFAAGMQALEREQVKAFVEIGPQPVLVGMGKQCVAAADDVLWLPSLRRDADAWQTILGSLGSLYVRGVNPDWKSFDRPYRRRRISLPTYAFTRKRFWISAAGEPEPLAAPTTGPQVYDVVWRKVDRSAPSAAGDVGRWLVLADRGGVGARVAERLERLGATCKVVAAGDLAPDEFQARWSSLAAGGGAPRGVVHLGALDAGAAPLASGEAPSTRCRQLIEQALSLVRAAAASPARLWVVTRGAMPVSGADTGPGALVQAPLWGLGRTVALEHPDLWGGLVDLGTGADPDAEAAQLVDEIVGPGIEDQVAFRGEDRYVARLVPGVLRTAQDMTLSGDASYIVTGGLGALGLHAARWLIGKGARHLVLTGRRGLSRPGAEESVRGLEALGARVTVVAADVSSRADVTRIVAAARADGRIVRGVVHAAGVDVPGSLVGLSGSDLDSVLGPKVDGTWFLHELTSGWPLDFFVCYSSVAATLGSVGRAHYGAANAFLDAFAHERRRQGLASLTVAWGPWAQGGMASEEVLKQFDRVGNRGLEPGRAMQVLGALLAGGDTYAAVADIDWARFRPVYEARRPRPFVSEATGRAEEAKSEGVAPVSATESTWADRLATTAVEGRLAELVGLLRIEAAHTLGFERPDEVPLDMTFYEMGMDSLMTAEFSARLQKRLGLQATKLVFDFPHIGSLAEQLLERLSIAEPADARQASTAVTEPVPASGPAVRATGTVGYSPDLEPEVFAFQKLAWPRRREDWIAPRWKWMFVESARRLGVEPRVWLHREDGRIVGHNGAIPVRVKIGGEDRLTAWLVDTMVLEEYRTRAVGSRLMVEAHEDLPFALSLGQTEQMRQIQLQLGWVQVAPLQTAQLLIRPERVLRGKLPGPAAQAAGLGMRATAAVRNLLRQSPRGTARQVDRFDGRHDDLWNRSASDATCAVVRDASYLNWKYVDQPGQDFLRLELVDGNDVRGVAVVMFRAPDEHYRYRRGFILDLVVPFADERVVGDLLQVASHAAAERGADALTCLHVNERLTRALRRAGFLMREPTRFLLVRPGPLDDALRSRVVDGSGWYVTQGDSDIDRPW